MLSLRWETLQMGTNTKMTKCHLKPWTEGFPPAISLGIKISLLFANLFNFREKPE